MHRLSGEWCTQAIGHYRRAVPALILQHRRLLLFLKLGSSWWNIPTGHLFDKWINLWKLCSQQLAFYVWVKSKPDRTGASFIFQLSYQVTVIFSSDFWADIYWKTVWIILQNIRIKSFIWKSYALLFQEQKECMILLACCDEIDITQNEVNQFIKMGLEYVFCREIICFVLHSRASLEHNIQSRIDVLIP